MAEKEVKQVTTTGFVPSLIIGLLILLFAGTICFLSLRPLVPPDAVPANAAAREFSSSRALVHLNQISKSPHPLGSPAHAEVRNYLVQQLLALGLKPELQEAATATNIVTRIKGTQNGKSLVLVGHYDSVTDSPGASDDGSAIAVMLETIRALQSRPPLANDVVFLFSDGEEVSSVGANAFVYHHEWGKNVGLVLNFEARGVRGPAIMFETSAENGWLVSQFAQAAPQPVANSYSYDIYRLLPNDTDFTVFKENGIAGLNFAFIGGSEHYHAKTDDLNHLDERSLQHQGSYALSLAQHFGNVDLSNPRAGDAIYFNFLGSTMVVYTKKLVWPIAILVTLILAAAITLGVRNGRLTVTGLRSGIESLLIRIGLSLGLIILIRWVAEVLTGGEHGQAILWISVIAALVANVIVLLRNRRSTSLDLLAGGVCGWLLLMFLANIILPGGSYLFAGPILFTAGALSLTLVRRQPFPATVETAIFTLGAVPTLLLIPPFVYLLFLALTVNSLVFSVLLAVSVALAVVPFIPPLYRCCRR